MKKTIGVLMSAALMISMAACGNSNKPEGTDLQQPAQNETTFTPKNILVAVYSYSGNTDAVAKQIAQATGATLFEITTNHQYPAEYNEHTAQVKKELQRGFKPKLTSKVENMEQYDMVFVGSPNWWGSYAPAVRTFLDSYDFKDKTIVPFFTNGGGGMQNCEKDMKKQLPEVTFGQAITFPGRSVGANKRELHNWLVHLGVAK